MCFTSTTDVYLLNYIKKGGKTVAKKEEIKITALYERLSSPDPTILYRQQSDRYFHVKFLPLLFYQIKGEQNYDHEPEESTVRLWQP